MHFRDGVEVYGGAVELNQKESRPLLLQVPPGYNPGDSYRLRIEGYHRLSFLTNTAVCPKKKLALGSLLCYNFSEIKIE